MRKWRLVLALMTSCAASSGYVTQCSHMLSVVTADGLVDYAALRNDPSLSACGKAIAQTQPWRLRPRERLMFWVNVYNLTSILDLARDSKRWGPKQDGKALFTDEKLVIGGQRYTLDQIEYVEMPKLNADPRIEFLLSCGSRGCSLLPPVLVTPENYDQLLRDGVTRFFGERWNLEIDWDNKTVFTSQLLAPDWHGKDFAATGETIEALIAKELSRRGDQRAADALLSGMLKLHYRPYDWRMNRVVRQFALP